MCDEEKKVTGEAAEPVQAAEEAVYTGPGADAQNVENPYLSKEETTTVPLQEGMASGEQKKKSPLKIIIPIVVVIAVLLIAALVFVFAGVFGNKKKVLAEALSNTFKESGDYLAQTWAMEQYDGMFEDETMTVEMEFELPDGIGLDMTVQQDGKTLGMWGEGSLSGMALLEFEVYQDEKDILISLPGMLDYVFTIDRETLEDDIWNLVDMGMLDEEMAEEIIALNQGEMGTEGTSITDEEAEIILKEIVDAWKLLYDACEVKKIDAREVYVNGQDVQAKGYLVTAKVSDIADFFDTAIAAYENSEEMSIMLETMLISQGYGDYSLEDAYDELYASVDELREEAEEILEVEFYIHDGMVAEIYSEDEDGETYFEWDIEGGNFPLENTTLFLGDDIDYIEISRTGSVEDGEYRAKYDIDDSYSVITMDFRYTQETGELSVEFLEDDYSMLFFAGSMEKQDDTTISFSIDSLEIEEEEIMSGDITISDDCGEIVKPEGEEKNLLLMDETEWEDIIWELAMSMY